MLRDHLSDIPDYPMPTGFRMRPFAEGDRDTWVSVETQSEPYIDITNAIFDREFGFDLPAMPKRCWFLVSPDSRDVGTITCWYDRHYGQKRWGRIHWVAIVPEFRGRRLAKCMMTFAMNHLRSLGHRRAILGTQPPRIPAIKTYLDFGFIPDMTADRAQRGWSMVRDKLSHPALDILE